MKLIYRRAFTEVYEILSLLEQEEYNRIPTDIIETIKENRDLDYEYTVDDEIELYDNQMLKETKAILYTLYRDYYADLGEKSRILKRQMKERMLIEEAKRQRYNPNEIFKKVAMRDGKNRPLLQ